MKIDIPKLLLRLRQREVGGSASERSSTWTERLLMRRWRSTVLTRAALERSASLGRFLQGPITRRNRIRKLPVPVLGGWTKARDFPPLAPKSFATIWRDELAGDGRG